VGYLSLAVGVLAMVLTVFLTGLAMLLNFYFRFARGVWKPTSPPESWKAVDDPIFRSYSRLKAWVSRLLDRRRGSPNDDAEAATKPGAALQRLGGKFAKPPEDVKEPDRTERILAQPYRLLRDRASDAAESMSLNLFVKASGKGLLGLTFAWCSMAIQISVAVLSGMGPYLYEGGYTAVGQMLAIALVKASWACVLILYMPCACLLSNAVIATQFLTEGVAVLILFAGDAVLTPQYLHEYSTSLQSCGFWLTLFAIFYPVVQKGYDGM
jgi:hypothetical protein